MLKVKHVRAALLLFGSLLLVRMGSAQASSSLDRFFSPPLSIRVTTGYTSLSLDEAEDYFRQVVNTYHDKDIPVPIQRLFPASLSIGGILAYEVRPDLEAELGVEGVQTEAYALYGDYAGTLDLTGQARLVVAFVGIRKHVLLLRPLRASAGIRLGAIQGKYIVDDVVRFDIPSSTTNHETLRASGYGYNGEGTGSLSILLGRLFLMAEAGYRYAKISQPNGRFSIVQPIGTTEDVDIPFALEFHGWLARAGLGIRLN